LASDGGAFLQADALQGNERHDVGDANARMHAGVGGEVNPPNRFSNAAQGALANSLRRAGAGDDGAVVIRIHLRP
jgi:hypothetical protein